MDNYTKGIFIGGLIGACYGLLKAPDSGKNTRSKIKKYFIELNANKKQVQHDVSNLQKSITHLRTDGIQSAVEFTEDVTSRMLNFQKDIIPQLEKITSLVNNLQNDLNE